MSKLPSIAIVGRPNVGKSTLYNRLTDTWDALVSDLPGLTRDRREGEAKIGGHAVTIIDTAGLEEAAKGSIQARMREQSEQALQMADVILFVIDARDGVTASDQVFARIARNAGKPVIAVANKSEGKKGIDGFYDTFSLGFGDPVPISAEQGEGLDELGREILSALGLKAVPRRKRGKNADQPAEESADDDEGKPQRPIRVAVVGRPNAGKSTLVNALLGEERMITGPEPGLTRDSVATDTVWQGRPIRLFDTAGLRKKAKIHEKGELLSASDAVRAIRFAEVVVVLVDAERPLEQQDLIIAEMSAEEGRAVVIAVNKWDLVEDKPKLLKDIRETIATKMSQILGVELVTLSARSGKGLDRLQDAVLRAHEVWNKRVATNKLNTWLSGALQRHAAPASKGRRIKIRYITQASARPPTFIAFSSQAGGLPQSYVKYLVNSLREAFDLPGTPIRFQVRQTHNPFADD
jgi:GTPase